MTNRKLKEDIYWVGAIDWKVRNFHGYLTQRGTTYNAYLILDDKITLIDTVKKTLTNELIEHIRTYTELDKIDYIVVNHVEMDHSGSLPEIMKLAKNATIVTNKAGEKAIRSHFQSEGWNFKIVDTNDVISIGKRTITFMTTPMVHWPDNMVSYVPEEKLLFSNDAFGQHIASSERFDDEYSLEVILQEAKKYYANIVLPYSSQVEKVLADASKLDIQMIAPSHGLIWRSHLIQILQEYVKWSNNQVKKKAVVIYDSMWGSTESIAKTIYKTFDKNDYKVHFFDLKENHISDIMTELIEAEFICVGSPTLNKGIMPSVASFLTYMTGLSPKNRKGILFGSYGWAQQNIKTMSEYFAKSEIQLLLSLNINYIPTEEQLRDIGSKVDDVINL